MYEMTRLPSKLNHILSLRLWDLSHHFWMKWHNFWVKFLSVIFGGNLLPKAKSWIWYCASVSFPDHYSHKSGLGMWLTNNKSGLEMWLTNNFPKRAAEIRAAYYYHAKQDYLVSYSFVELFTRELGHCKLSLKCYQAINFWISYLWHWSNSVCQTALLTHTGSHTC